VAELSKQYWSAERYAEAAHFVPTLGTPALELLAPRLRPGAVVVCDNTGQFRENYRDFFAFVQDPRNGMATLTLPFQGGLEFCVKL